MLSTKDFILLKMIFNEFLYEAVFEKSIKTIQSILNTTYQYETSQKFYQVEPITVEMIEEIIAQHIEEMKDDDLEWAL